MKITYSHIEARFRESIETEFAHQVAKLDRLLKRYRRIRCSFTRRSKRRRGKPVSTSRCTSHCRRESSTPRAAARTYSAQRKAAFAEIQVQAKKHQEKATEGLRLEAQTRPRVPVGQAAAIESDHPLDRLSQVTRTWVRICADCAELLPRELRLAVARFSRHTLESIDTRRHDG